MTTRERFEEMLDRLYRETDESELPEDAVHAWDFRRLAYDQAVGGAWDEEIERPFVENAPRHLKRRAMEAIEEMIEDHDKIHEFNEQSLDYRDAVEGELGGRS